MNKLKNPAIAYGIVTFCVGIACAVVGHYSQGELWAGPATIIAAIGALLGCMSIFAMLE